MPVDIRASDVPEQGRLRPLQGNIIILSTTLRREITTTIRMLAADGVERANSGHPGAPMGLADIAFVLWDEFLPFRSEGTDLGGA